MYETQDQIFLYHGYGLACGGYVERKGERFAIDSVAAGAISIAGGYSETTQKEWRYPGPKSPRGSRGSAPPGDFFISIGETTTRVWSDWKQDEEGAWVTTAESRVSGFNLDGVVTADLLVARLTSVHYKQRKGVKKQQPRISFKGSAFGNLKVKIARTAIPESMAIPIDEVLDDFQTHSELKDALNGKVMPKPRKGFTAGACKAWSRDVGVRNLLEGDDRDREYVRDLRKKFVSKSLTRCSIAGPLSRPNGIGGKGYSIEIDGWGRVFFGEMIVSDSMKQLSMIRFDLGCDTCAAGLVPAVAVNGESMP